MKRKRYFIFSILTLVLFGFIYVFIYNIQGMNRKKEYIEISFLVRGKMPSIYETMRQGAEQAANDYKAEISFITLSEENNAEEQERLMEREWNNGAKAIVVSAADSEGMRKTAERIADKIPIITAESPINSEKIKKHIGADDYEMGQKIAMKVWEKIQKEKRITILVNDVSSKAIQDRLKGVQEGLKEQELESETAVVSDNLEEASAQIEQILKSGQANILITLDTALLETTGQLIQMQEKGEDISLYGIGATPKIASYLEKGAIHTIIVPNDFNVGYLGVKAAVSAVEKKQNQNFNNYVEFRVINRDTMYKTENERALFPFVR